MMKTTLAFLLLGAVAADFQQHVAGEDVEGRDLGYGGYGGYGGCKWTCDDSPSYYYASKAGMKGYYSRRTEEKETERELPGKGFGGGFYGHHGDCYWDCSYGGGMYGGYGGYMCFPTYTDGDYCDCTCCGHLPVYEESSPSYYYVSKAGRKGHKGGYYSRRTEETNEETAERELPWGGGMGYGYGGVGIMCNCDCDSPTYYPSKAGMKGNKGGYSSYGHKGGYYSDSSSFAYDFSYGY